MNVLVTGATGFVGKRLVDVLRNEARVKQLICLARSCPGEKEPRVKWVEGDICTNGWKSMVGNIDTVVHVAANASFTQSCEEAKSNLIALKQVLAFAESSDASKFLFISSIGAVDRKKGDDISAPLDDASTPSPRSAYGRSKLEGEKLVEQSRLPWVIIRPAWVYGREMRRSSHLSRLAKMTNDKSFLSLFNWPGEVSVVHVEDLCLFINNVLFESGGEDALGKRVFAASQSLSFGEIFKAFGAELGNPKAGKIPIPCFPARSLVRRFHSILPIQFVNLFAGYLTCNEARFLALLKRKPRMFNESCRELTKGLKSIERKWLITGAGNGIGKALFEGLERSGNSVTGVDKEFTSSPEGSGKRVLLDLALPDSAALLGQLVKKEEIDVVVNNAGIAYRTRFEDLGAKKTAEMLAVNVVFPAVFASEILKDLRRRGGVLVNVASSVAGIPLPGLAVYSASKSFIDIWSLGVAAENSNEMQIVTVWPTGTKTEFQGRAGVKTTGKLLEADYVAEQIRQAVERDVRRIFIGPAHVQIAMALGRLLPKSIQARFWGVMLDLLR